MKKYIKDKLKENKKAQSLPKKLIFLGIAILLVSLGVWFVHAMTITVVSPINNSANNTYITNESTVNISYNINTYTASWIPNTTINASLPDYSYTQPSVFYKDSSWYMLIGDTYADIYGFAYNGTNWLPNSTINSSLIFTGASSDARTSIFYKDSSWYSLGADGSGKTYGHTWNGTQWVVNLTINSSLPDVGSRVHPNVFNFSSDLYLLLGEIDKGIFGFAWNGTTWLPNSTINSSLSFGSSERPSPYVFNKGGTNYLVVGLTSGYSPMFSWNGTNWIKEFTLNSSLTNLYDVASYTKPAVFYKDSSWYLVSGSADGYIYGFALSEDNSLNSIIYSWGGTNTTILDYTSILFYNFDNRSALGENDTFVRDLSMYENNGTVVGGNNISWTSNGKYGGAFNFSGDLGYINTSNKFSFINFTNNWTISLWVFVPSNVSRNIIFKDNSFALNTAADYRIQFTDRIAFSSLSSSSFYPTNSWFYLTVYHNIVNNFSICINNVCGLSDNTINSFGDSTGFLVIGRNSGSSSLNGSIDDVMIWNRSLSQIEMSDLYNTQIIKYNPQDYSIIINKSLNYSSLLLNSSNPIKNNTYFICSTNSTNTICSDQKITQNIPIVTLKANFTNTLSNVSERFYGQALQSSKLVSGYLDTDCDGTSETPRNYTWQQQTYLDSHSTFSYYDASFGTYYNGVENPSFEFFKNSSIMNATSWTAQRAWGWGGYGGLVSMSNESHSGLHSLNLTGQNVPETYIYSEFGGIQELGWKNNSNYTAKIWAKGNGTSKFVIKYRSGGYPVVSEITMNLNNTWQEYIVSYNVSSAYYQYYIIISSINSTEVVLLDDFSMTENGSIYNWWRIDNTTDRENQLEWDYNNNVKSGLILSYTPLFLANRTSNCVDSESDLDYNDCMPYSPDIFTEISIDYYKRVDKFRNWSYCQIWNEPDISFFEDNLASCSAKTDFVVLFNNTYTGFEEYNPNIEIAGWRGAQSVVTPTSICAFTQMMLSNLSSQHKVFSFHPYESYYTNNARMSDKINYLLSQCAMYGANCSKIYLDEWQPHGTTTANIIKNQSNGLSQQYKVNIVYPIQDIFNSGHADIISESPYHWDDSVSYFNCLSRYPEQPAKYSSISEAGLDNVTDPVYYPPYTEIKKIAEICPIGSNIKETYSSNSNITISSCQNVNTYGLIISNINITSSEISLNLSLENGTCGYLNNNFTNLETKEVYNVVNCMVELNSDAIMDSYQEGGTNNILYLTSGVPPTITSIQPANLTINMTTAVSFSANLTDDVGLTNSTLYLLNDSDKTLITNLVTYVSGEISVIQSWLITLADGVYHWWISLFDDEGKETVSGNYTETIAVPPTFTTIPNNQSIFYKNQTLNVTFIGTDETGFSGYFVNDTKFKIGFLNGFLENNTQLSAGNYTINVTINDTHNNINWTFYKVQVNKSNYYDCGVYFNTSTPITFPSNFIVYTNCSSAYTLYRNGTSISNGSTINSGAGYYNLTVQRTDTQNYTNTVNSQFFTINKATPTGSTSSSSGWTLTYPTSTTISFSESNGGDTDVNYYIWRDGVNKSTGETVTLGQGTYTYILNTSGGLNYSSNANMDIDSLVVSKNTSSCSIYFSTTSPVTFPTTFIAYTNCTSSYTMYLNGSSISNATTINSGSGYFNITVQRTDTSNYTNTVNSQFFTVSKNSEQFKVLFNDTSPITFPSTFLVWSNCTTANTLKRNGTTISNNSEQRNGAGYYNFSVQRTDTQNYTYTYNQSLFTVSKASGDCNVFFNTTSPLVYPELFTANTDCTTAYTLKRNTTSITNNSIINSGVSAYNISVQRTDTQNYTYTFDDEEFRITPNQDSCSVYFNATSPLIHPEFFIAYTNCTSTYTLTQNGTTITNGSTINRGATAYNVSVQRTDTQNYSNKVHQLQFIINKNSEKCQVFYNETSPLAYPNNFLVWSNCSTSFTLKRNNTEVLNNSEQDLTYGAYNFSMFRTDTQNYTNNYNESEFRITDTTSPVITIESPQNTSYYNQTVLFNFTIDEDNLDTVTYNYNTTNLTWTAAVIQTITHGFYSLYLWVSDLFGNIGTSTEYFSVDIINVTLNSPTDNQIIYENPVTFNVSSVSIYNFSNISLYTNHSGNWILNETYYYSNSTHQGYYYLMYNDTTERTADYEYDIPDSWIYNVSYDTRATSGSENTRVIFTYEGGATWETAYQEVNYLSWSNDIFTNPNTTLKVTKFTVDVDATHITYKNLLAYGYGSRNNYTTTFSKNIVFGESYIWNAYACDTEGYCDWFSSNYTVMTDTTSPVITITSPTGIYNNLYQNYNHTLIVNSSDNNLDACWLEYNNTNTTINCNNQTYTTNYFSQELGDYNLTIWANDTLNNLNSKYINWTYKTEIDNITYEEVVYDTEVANYTIFITANTSLTDVTLYLNGTPYTTTQSGYIWTHTLAIPSSIVGNNSIIFGLNYSGTEYNSTTSYQEILPIQLGLCNATLIVPYLNFTFKNEDDSSQINGTISSSTFDYYLGNGTNYKTYTYSVLTNASSYTFCTLPANRPYNIDITLNYKLGSIYDTLYYPQRTWNPSVTSYTNSTTNQTLYLLSSEDGQDVTFQVLNVAGQTISGVSVEAYRVYGSSRVFVASGTTSSTGSLTFFLNKNYEHIINFTKTGYTQYTFDEPPTQTAYTITLSSSASSTNDYRQGIKLSKTPLNSSLFENSITDFTFTITSDYYTLVNFSASLYFGNGTLIGLDNSTTGTGGTITFSNVNVTNQSVYMHYNWSINTSIINGVYYWINSGTEGREFSIWHFFQDFNDYTSESNGGLLGLDDFGRGLLAVIFIVLIVGTMGYRYGIQSEPMVLGMIFGIVLFLDTMNFIPKPDILGILPLDNFLTIITALILIGFVVKEEMK